MPKWIRSSEICLATDWPVRCSTANTRIIIRTTNGGLAITLVTTRLWQDTPQGSVPGAFEHQQPHVKASSAAIRCKANFVETVIERPGRQMASVAFV
jgi:hypothetical protein